MICVQGHRNRNVKMPTITRWGQVKERIKQASGGGCDEAAAIGAIANEGDPRAAEQGPVAGFHRAGARDGLHERILSLPYQFERAFITAEQVFNGDLNMGWYAIEDGSTYIDPALWGDAVLLDLGTRATERAFFGSGQVYAQARYPEDASVLVRFYGNFGLQPVYVQKAVDGVFKAQNFEDLTPDSTLSAVIYD